MADRRTLAGIAVGLAAVGAALLLLGGDPTPAPVPAVSPRVTRARPAAPEPPAHVRPSDEGSPRAESAPASEGVSGGLATLDGQLREARRAAPDDGTRDAVLAVVTRAEAEAATLRAAVRAGEVPEGELRARIGKIRLDAATSFDGATGPEASRALKEALGFDMRGADELGWGVPLNDANLGQVFDDG